MAESSTSARALKAALCRLRPSPLACRRLVCHCASWIRAVYAPEWIHVNSAAGLCLQAAGSGRRVARRIVLAVVVGQLLLAELTNAIPILLDVRTLRQRAEHNTLSALNCLSEIRFAMPYALSERALVEGTAFPERLKVLLLATPQPLRG